MEKRMITTDVTEEDLPLEGNLRPQTLDEYIGQEKTKNTLKIYRNGVFTVPWSCGDPLQCRSDTGWNSIELNGNSSGSCYRKSNQCGRKSR